MSTAGTWHRIGSELAARGWDCLAVDLPGHGDSPPLRGPLDLDALVSGVACQLTEPVDVVVGHSLGGVVALALVASRRGAARAVVLEDPPGSRGFDINAFASQIAADAAAARDDLSALRRRERGANPRWTDDDVEQSIAGIAAAQTDAIVEALAGRLTWDLPAMLAVQPVPVLVLAGAELSGTFPFEGGGSALNGRDRADVRAVLEEHRFVVIDGGHCLHRDAPDQWIEAVIGFVEPYRAMGHVARH